MPRFLRHHLVLTLWACLCAGAGAAAQEPAGMPAELHPWGRFKPGAWKQYRVLTETFDEQGKVLNTNTTYTTTTLKPGGQSGSIALLVEAVVEMAGKRLDTPPSLVTRGLYDESPGDKLTVSPLPAEPVAIEGRPIPCRVERAEVAGPSGKTTTKTWYSATVAPHILRRESRAIDPEGKATETTLSVEALTIPCDLLPNITRAARVVVTTIHPKGKTVTRALTSIEVPGGVICHTAEEFDSHGRLARRSTLTLIEYGLTPKKEHSGLFNRIRSRGHRSHRYSPAP